MTLGKTYNVIGSAKCAPLQRKVSKIFEGIHVLPYLQNLNNIEHLNPQNFFASLRKASIATITYEEKLQNFRVINPVENNYLLNS